ncbi:hypothetical protein GUJ93_ZPchr0657g29116 [Zizania palustris]|uniref:UspA domain-containing protein n=1 Tax=Zizania palustris TaxID=103762 RepID=A0A8J5RFA4_ZIZPA|nr:hypothetical protein GUJ93_ZPchr0657g29116 [Zizania palustris]
MPHLLQLDSPGVFFSTATMAAPLGSTHCRIVIAIDLSDESAYTIRSAVANYLLSRDVVILLHVRPTSVHYGAN